MEGINFFFPDSNAFLPAGVCYLIIIVSAHRRYSMLAVDYGSYDAPESSRPWTTIIRYYTSSISYLCLCALLYAVLYHLFIKYPDLVAWVIRNLPSKIANDFLEPIIDNKTLLAPILTAACLTWAIPKYSKFKLADQKIRMFFQRLGSIPVQLNKLIGRMKQYEISTDPDECLVGLPDAIKNEILRGLKNNEGDKKSLENLYLRASQMNSRLCNWSEKGSSFFHYCTIFRKQHRNIKTAFQKFNRDIVRYYNLKEKSREIAATPGPSSSGASSEKAISEFKKLLKEQRRDLKEELKGILEHMYTFLACGINSEGWSAKSRNRHLKALGFKPKENGSGSIFMLDINDMTVLLLYLFIIIPVAFIFLAAISRDVVMQDFSKKYLIWSVMAVSVGMSIVQSSVFIKQKLDRSDKRFWTFLRKSERKPWFCFFLSGIIAGTVSVFIMACLSYLLETSGITFMDNVLSKTRWFLVPFAVSVLISYHLESTPQTPARGRITETITTGLGSLAAAAVVLFLTLDVKIDRNFIEKTVFVLPAALLLGGFIGAFVPNRYRLQRKPPVVIDKKQIDLKSLILECISEHNDAAENRGLTIKEELSKDISHIQGDAGKIKQMINGLLKNAIKYTQEGGQVTIQAKIGSADDVSILIIDNGIGMSETKISRAVDQVPSEQDELMEFLDDEASPNLLQVKRIAELHGGKLVIASEEHKGTEARVKLPQGQTSH